MTDRDWERGERGRRYRGEGYYGGYYEPERERDYSERRREERTFWDRFGDELRRWFGDEEARRRRERDEREDDWRSGWARGSAEERRWGGAAEEADRRQARGWGYSGGSGAGAGYMGSERSYGEPSSSWRFGERGGEYESERYGAGWRSGVPRGPHAGRGPRGYQRSDERIREDLCELMCEHGALDCTEIEVRVSQGEVTLVGTVVDRVDKRLAEDLAEQVSGVRDVHNQLRVSHGEAQPEDQSGRPGGEPPRYRVA